MIRDIVFPFAYVQINADMEIVFSNEVFKDAFIINESGLLKMTDIFENFNVDENVQAAELEDKCYRIFFF